MRARQYRTIGAPPEVVEIAMPEPGPGQVRLKITAAGVCHSDAYVMGRTEEEYTYGLPLTLGHEGAGVVDKLGEGVHGVQIGDPVAVYGPWGCGRCYKCAQGMENYCENSADEGIFPPGLGAPGSMAEYMLVDDSRHLVPLGDLDPVANVSLTDAGLTPYHAIKASLTKLGPGSTAVVIGAGGLGHVAIQILRALTAATVIALDVNDEKLQLATDVGAHHAFLSDPDAIDKIKALTGGKGAQAVFDFVVIQPTIGAISDHTASRLGRRKPYILVGGLLLDAGVGRWWLDPLAALAIAVLVANESRGVWRGKSCDDCCRVALCR